MPIFECYKSTRTMLTACSKTRFCNFPMNTLTTLKLRVALFRVKLENGFTNATDKKLRTKSEV